MSALLPLVAKDGTSRGHVVVDAADAEWLGQWTWRLNGRGYVQRWERGRMILIHRLLLGLEPGDGRYGDHINGDRLDNRRSNLRVATAAENAQNRTGWRNATSRYRGVCWDKVNRNWIATITVNRRSVWLGRFRREEDAATAVRAARREMMPFAGERE